MTAQDVPDGGWIDGEAEFQSFTLELIALYPWVLTGDADKQCFNVGFEPWSSCAIRLPERPFTSDGLPVPVWWKNSVWHRQ